MPGRRSLARQVASGPAGLAEREAQLEHLAGGVARDQLARRALGDDPALVHDDEPVAQLLGLVHVVRGEHQRDAALLEPEQPVPQHVPGLRVEAGGRLVEQHEVGLVDQRAGDREPPLHAAGQRLDLVVARGRSSCTKSSSSSARARITALRQAEVAAVDEQVLPDGELEVEGVLLRDDAEPAADRRAVGGRVQAEDAQLAGGGRGDAADHPHGRGLARAVGAEEAERLARRDVDVDAVDRGEVAEPLDQPAGADQRARRRPPVGGPGGRLDVAVAVHAAHGSGDPDGGRTRFARRRSSAQVREEQADLAGGRLGRVRAVDDVRLHLEGEVAADGAGERLDRVGGAGERAGTPRWPAAPRRPAPSSGPLVMNSTSEAKNGRSRCSA